MKKIIQVEHNYEKKKDDNGLANPDLWGFGCLINTAEYCCRYIPGTHKCKRFLVVNENHLGEYMSFFFNCPNG